MAHDEKGVGKLRVDMLVLISGPVAMTDIGEKGTLFLSGPKLWFNNGTNPTLVTSA